MKVLCAIICVALLLLSPVVFLIMAVVEFEMAMFAGGGCLVGALVAAAAWGVWNIAENVEGLAAAARKRKAQHGDKRPAAAQEPDARLDAAQRHKDAVDRAGAQALENLRRNRASSRPSPTPPI